MSRCGSSLTAGALLLVVAGCDSPLNMSALEPAGPLAQRTSGLWWFAFGVSAAVYVATVGALVWALWRARRRERSGDVLPADSQRRMTRSVSLAVAATVVILIVWFFVDMSVERTLRDPRAEHPLTIQVVGHQWWWEVRYAGAPQEHFITANEIHIPTGQPVQLELSSSDVIHSVWVPSLAGKKDLIPGYKDTLWFQADLPGVYRGQCAEFCGHQHAKMGLLVIAEHPDSFARWQDRMRKPASPPDDSTALRGQEVFMTRQCMLCHNIEGTPAGSIAGPDLTHVASRLTIASGTLENTRDNMARWIRDPQGVKPGAQMPQPELTSAELDALVAYLESLQ